MTSSRDDTGTDGGGSSGESRVSDHRADRRRLRVRFRAFRERLLSGLFGDRAGLAIFLSAVVFLGALWRVEFLLNDSATVANVLANVADGRLSVVEAPYSLSAGEQPGLIDVDGRLYGRNYGQVYLAVPLVWLLDALAGLVDLRLLLAAGWSLAILALGRTVAGLLDRPVIADAAALVALVAYGAALLVATRMDWYTDLRPLVALGLLAVLLAAIGATVLYRVLAWAGDRSTAIAGGLALVVATPVGFWGTFPKRHVLTATALLVGLYLFAVSRADAGRRRTLARAGAYGVFGYLASVHAFEAAFALAVLAPLDLLTAPANDRRTLAVVVAVLLVGLTPMLATNAAISGDPLSPPRLHPSVDTGQPLDPGAATPGSQSGSPGGGNQTAGDSGGDLAPGGGADRDGTDGGVPWLDLLGPLAPIVTEVIWIGMYMFGALTDGLAVLPERDRLVSIFVRSGWIPDVAYHMNDYETLELAFLEALPLAGALAWLPVAAATRIRAGRVALRDRLEAGLSDPRRQTDLFAVALACTFTLVYLPYLPLWATITVRYVLPAMPLVLYGVCRLRPVRSGIADATVTLVIVYGATLFAGGAGFLAVHWTLDPAVGEAVQLHALVGLATAGVLGMVAATWPAHRRSRAVAVAVALAAGATTLFVILAALVYFAGDHHALDLGRLVAEVIGPLG